MTRVSGIQRARSNLLQCSCRAYVLPRTIRKTDLVLAGQAKSQMIEVTKVAIDKNELPAMESL